VHRVLAYTRQTLFLGRCSALRDLASRDLRIEDCLRRSAASMARWIVMLLLVTSAWAGTIATASVHVGGISLPQCSQSTTQQSSGSSMAEATVSEPASVCDGSAFGAFNVGGETFTGASYGDLSIIGRISDGLGGGNSGSASFSDNLYLSGAPSGFT
jgi:hypothetical protein